MRGRELLRYFSGRHYRLLERLGQLAAIFSPDHSNCPACGDALDGVKADARYSHSAGCAGNERHSEASSNKIEHRESLLRLLDDIGRESSLPAKIKSVQPKGL